MGVSRYDKNADQLCQILDHMRQNKHFNNLTAEHLRVNMMIMIEAMLIANDSLGEMAGKGLI